MPGYPARCSLFILPPGLSPGPGGRCGRICSRTADRSRRGRRQRCPRHVPSTSGDAGRSWPLSVMSTAAHTRQQPPDRRGRPGHGGDHPGERRTGRSGAPGSPPKHLEADLTCRIARVSPARVYARVSIVIRGRVRDAVKFLVDPQAAVRG
jgi:hypothetical protein